MNTPNFIVLGAAKSGTTSLYKYLTQHPNTQEYLKSIYREDILQLQDLIQQDLSLSHWLN